MLFPSPVSGLMLWLTGVYSFKSYALILSKLLSSKNVTMNFDI